MADVIAVLVLFFIVFGSPLLFICFLAYKKMYAIEDENGKFFLIRSNIFNNGKEYWGSSLGKDEGYWWTYDYIKHAERFNSLGEVIEKADFLRKLKKQEKLNKRKRMQKYKV
ncbi:hypothetical protein phiOC_p272 [Ochrobactrum phage vB_OspM_OC]|nr:hypothetical protein phiOC_p272 [Ochrobactrum phage vB_OspM_OC]